MSSRAYTSRVSSTSELPFRPAVVDWFQTSFPEPTPVQRAGWAAIARGDSALLLAPTGSGKTLAAFLAAIDGSMFVSDPGPKRRLRVVYVSPLKALAADVEKNLRVPIAGIAALCRRRGIEHRIPELGLRSGDTPARDRARFIRSAPDILITTPESLYLLLTSAAREQLALVETVIVDEIHAVAGSKRGAHLSLSLERLEALRSSRAPLQRIGLSATQRPLEEIARLLGGFAEGRPRPVQIVDAAQPKQLLLSVELPEAQADRAETTALLVERHTSAAGRAGPHAPRDHDLRQQPKARGASGGGHQRDGG